MTERACLPDPPCDWLTVTLWPVCCCHFCAKALLMSTYSSRVGSYETLRSLTCARAVPPAASMTPTIETTTQTTEEANGLRDLNFLGRMIELPSMNDPSVD